MWTIWHDFGFSPHYFRKVQIREPRDHHIRDKFCEWKQPRVQILPNIVFMNETQFTCDVLTVKLILIIVSSKIQTKE